MSPGQSQPVIAGLIKRKPGVTAHPPRWPFFPNLFLSFEFLLTSKVFYSGSVIMEAAVEIINETLIAFSVQI